jgi:hypothetical protein
MFSHLTFSTEIEEHQPTHSSKTATRARATPTPTTGTAIIVSFLFD